MDTWVIPPRSSNATQEQMLWPLVPKAGTRRWGKVVGDDWCEASEIWRKQTGWTFKLARIQFQKTERFEVQVDFRGNSKSAFWTKSLSPSHSLTQQDGHHGHRPEAVLAVVCVFLSAQRLSWAQSWSLPLWKDCFRWSTTCVVSQKIGNGLVCRAFTDHLGHA